MDTQTGLNHVADEFKKLLNKADLPDIRFHDLRRSATTLLLILGIHLKVVQEMLGHTLISMMMDIYLAGMQQDAVSKLNDLLMKHEARGVIEDRQAREYPHYLRCCTNGYLLKNRNVSNHF